MTFNISSNYTIHTMVITTQDIASLVYYPLILLILIILPIIVLITVLILKLSNTTKIFILYFILYFNIVYSLLLPIIGASIVTDFQLKSYIYGIILKDPFIISAFYFTNVTLAEMFRIIASLMYIYVMINILTITMINLSQIWKYIDNIIKLLLNILIIKNNKNK